MCIDNCPSAKAAAGKLRMKSDLFRLEPKHVSNCHLIHSLKLGRNPGLGAVTIESHCSIQRLHRRVSKIWKLVFGGDSTGPWKSFKCLLIAARDSNIASRSHQFLVPGPQL